MLRTTVPRLLVTLSFHACAAITPECTATLWPEPIRIEVGPIVGATRPAPMSDVTAVRTVASFPYAMLPGQVVVSASRCPEITLNVTVEPAANRDPLKDPA